MKKIFYIIFLLGLSNISFGQELFVGYLKPFVKKTSEKIVFKKRDPMEEPYKVSQRFLGDKVIKEEKPKDIELKAILYHPVHKKAYIGESLVAEGSKIGEDYIVKQIYEDRVVVVKEKKEYTLKIEEGDVK